VPHPTTSPSFLALLSIGRNCLSSFNTSAATRWEGLEPGHLAGDKFNLVINLYYLTLWYMINEKSRRSSGIHFLSLVGPRPWGASAKRRGRKKLRILEKNLWGKEKLHEFMQ